MIKFWKKNHWKFGHLFFCLLSIFKKFQISQFIFYGWKCDHEIAYFVAREEQRVVEKVSSFQKEVMRLQYNTFCC